MTEEIVRVEHLKKAFKRNRKSVLAVDDVSFLIRKGECLGLIGESGSGKSTIAGILSGFQRTDEGNFYLKGREMLHNKQYARENRRYMQTIFQNPLSSLNPRMTIGKNLEEALLYYEKTTKEERVRRAEEVMEMVELPRAYLKKHPMQISGGECQRVCIARALMRNPDFLICDEMTSALDVSVQAKVLNILQSLQKEYQMAMLFISHDIAVVSNVCDSVLVLQEGRIAESGAVRDVLRNPTMPYTKNLINSVILLQ